MLKRFNLKRWLSVLLTAIFVIPIIMSLLGFISIRNVLTTSMSPKIQPGDLVVSANWVKPTVGDTAIYLQKSIDGSMTQEVVHRVITLNANNEYQFKGDNNAAMDALPVPRSDVIGTVFLKVPGIGRLLNLAGLFLVTLFVGGLWLVGYGIKKIRK
jgi:signal peptidase I